MLVVLTNYKRPNNVVKAIAAWRPQCDELIVVDNSSGGRDAFFADDTWSWRKNSGPPCRWVPAFLKREHEHVVFADDDFLPAPDAVQRMLDVRKPFATIGTHGRNFTDKYVYGNVYGTCSMTVRMHMVHTSHMWMALAYRERLIAKYGTEAIRLAAIHDDFMLCLGIRLYTGYDCYTLPNLIVQELHDNDAVHKRPEHLAERNRLVEMWNHVHLAR